MAQPKPISDELFQEVNAWPFGVRADPNDWNVKRLRKRIEQLKSVDRSSYLDLLGALSSVTWDEAEMRSAHEASVRRSPNAISSHDNYVCSLFRMGFFAEAAARAMTVLQIEPNDARLWRRASEVSLAAGKIRLAFAQHTRALELAPDTQSVIPQSPVAAVARAGDLLRITDESAQLAISMANNVQHRHGCYGVVASVGVLDSDEQPIISYLMGVPATCNVRALNVDLASELASADELGDSSANLVVRYVEAVSTDADLTNRVA
jgi:tetratricopeptide (TPR) repeat protein